MCTNTGFLDVAELVRMSSTFWKNTALLLRDGVWLKFVEGPVLFFEPPVVPFGIG